MPRRISAIPRPPGHRVSWAHSSTGVSGSKTVLRERLVEEQGSRDGGIEGVAGAEHRDRGDAVGSGEPLRGKTAPFASDNDGQLAAIVNVPVRTAAGGIGGNDLEAV